jgi:hypothetical protein
MNDTCVIEMPLAMLYCTRLREEPYFLIFFASFRSPPFAKQQKFSRTSHPVLAFVFPGADLNWEVLPLLLSSLTGKRAV